MNKEVYDRYSLLNLPRNFGFPMQMSLQSIKQLERIIDANDGKVPLYISGSGGGVPLNAFDRSTLG